MIAFWYKFVAVVGGEKIIPTILGRGSGDEGKIIKAQYVKDYILRLTFNNGEIRLVDFTPLMQKGICTKLQDMDYFRSFTLDPFTVDWNNEIGFAPRYLYERSIIA